MNNKNLVNILRWGASEYVWRSMKLSVLGILLAVGAAGQSLDSGGNGLLNGNYYFRHVAYYLADANGDLGDAISVFGSITFDGKGNYTTSGTFVDGAQGSINQFSNVTGTYTVSASGLGAISFPDPVTGANDTIYGLVSKGIFIGSATENTDNFNDLFIGAPIASPAPTAASFSGSYSISYMNFLSGDPSSAYDAQFVMNPDGKGNVGTVNVTGYTGTGGSTPFNISETGVRYIFSSGAANVSFPNSTTLPVVGSEFLYFSPDGNFVFGGSPQGFDMIVGVKLGSGTPNLSGLYYQAGLDEDESTLSGGYATADSYYGSFFAGGGNILAHQRIVSPLNSTSYDYTVADPFSINPDGSMDDTAGFHYVFGLGGAIRVGFGKGPYLGITVAIQAPTFTGPGVFLNPTGLQSAASSALFTAGISPGEFILLNGTGFTSTTATSSSFPTTLGNVQVMINAMPAPLYVVSPTLIEALVPFNVVPNSIASIQVISNGTPSNTISAFTSLTAPGVFTVPPGGIGYAAAQHAADYSLITPQNPAHIGETIIVYGTGLGATNPAIDDGTPAPATSLVNANSPISVFVDGLEATVGFAGLTPTAIGLYQANITIPAGVDSGDVFLDVSGPDSYTSQAKITIAPAGSVARPHVVKPHRPLPAAKSHRNVPSLNGPAARLR